MVHAVKAYPRYYRHLVLGDKSFEVRKNDRPYAVGDILAVNEFIPIDQIESKANPDWLATLRKVKTGYYTGAGELFKITYILDDPQFCKEGMVILGLKEVPNEPKT